jgi:phage portal protein BeeE
MLHIWVEKNLGKPKECVLCGEKNRKRYHWANISNRYKKDLSDWRRLCVPCHRRENNIRFDFCKKGHKLTKGNTYIRKITKFKECRICRKMYVRKWRAKIRRVQ